jgi:hypothetical protein
MSPYLLTNRAKWVITIAVLAGYPFFLVWLIKYYGLSVITLSVIPVSLIGFLFGIYGGIGAGFYAILINILILILAKGNWLDSGFLSGCIILLFVGTVTGRLKQNIENRLRKEAELQSRERYLSLLNKMTHCHHQVR